MPTAIKDFFLSDRNIGASWESLPTDLSEKRLCEVRCFGVMDDSSNWAPTPKYMLAEGDTYTKWPDDETYPLLAVNYVKLDRVPVVQRGLGYGDRGPAHRQLLRHQRRGALP